jgi:tetratricopeptide (TPR) repeat protein
MLRATDAEARGEWEEAGRLFALRFRRMLAERRPAEAVDALRGQARVRMHQARHDEAEEFAELALCLAELHGMERDVARALNVQGMIEYARGRWPEARRLFHRALERALDLGDDELAGLACMNAGVIANSLGDHREARMRYLESIGSFVRSGNSDQAMLAYNNLGMVSADLREWMEAQLYFGRGIEIGERLSRTPLLAKLYCNRAEPLIQIGEHARAMESLDRAERHALAVGDLGLLVDVSRFRAVVDRVRGRFDDAEAHLQRALDASREPGLALGRAEALCEAGRLSAERGEPGRARERLEEARATYLRIGAAREAAALDDAIAALQE